MPAVLAALWPALQPIMQALFAALLPMIWKVLNAPDTAENSLPDDGLRERLLKRLHGDAN